MNNQNKKILLVITKSNFGGAQKYVYELAKNLTSRGMHVQVALGGEGILIEKLRAAHIEVFVIPNLGRDISPSDDMKVFFDLYKIIRNEKPDVVHLNSSKIGGIGVVASRLAGVPKIIFTIHGWAFNESRGILSKIFIKISYLVTILFSTKAIAVSEATNQQAKSLPLYFLIKNKIRIVRNGIEVPLFLSKELSRGFLSSKLHIDLEGKTIIGQIAEFHPIKDIATTIKAAESITYKNPHTIFIIIGAGEEQESLQKQINSLNLQEKIFLTGFIDNAATYLKTFDLFCLTSKSEALGLVLLEAGLARVPVIASRVGGVPELIKNNMTGWLFESGDVHHLETQIQHVINLPQIEREKITQTFFEKIQKNFLIENMIAETVKLY